MLSKGCWFLPLANDNLFCWQSSMKITQILKAQLCSWVEAAWIRSFWALRQSCGTAVDFALPMQPVTHPTSAVPASVVLSSGSDSTSFGVFWPSLEAEDSSFKYSCISSSVSRRVSYMNCSAFEAMLETCCFHPSPEVHHEKKSLSQTQPLEVV